VTGCSLFVCYNQGMKSELALTGTLYKQLEGKWVALTLDHKKIINSSDDLASLEEKIGNKKNVVFMKVLASDREFAF